MTKRNNQILFKKTSPKGLIIGDVNPLRHFTMTYSYLDYKDIPTGSGQFTNALREGKLLIINGTDTIPDGIIKSYLNSVGTIVQEDLEEVVQPEKPKKEPKLEPIKSVFELLGIQKSVNVIASQKATKIIEEDDLISGVNNFLLKK